MRRPGRDHAARDDDVVALSSFLETRRASAGEVLFRHGQPPPGAWVMREGMVELSVTLARRRHVVEILCPGDVEGDIALILDQPPPYDARALEEVVCLFVSARSFDQLLVSRPAVTRRWMSSIAARMARGHVRIVELIGRPLSGQVVSFPQATLAAMLGVHRPALNKVLKQLERRSLISVGYAQIRITDRPGLEGVAGGR